MRNLKKILALVLALIMSLSLMATAGAASFPDVDADNPYATAIDVLDGLKVFQGFEDGTFKPTDTLNRAQAAVLVYRIATGDVDNKFVANYTDMAQSKFTDLDGYNWARGYINYCQNAKIVVGTSATTFDPGAPVTGYQLMVMLLRTLGYGAAGEFTDPTKWELETAKIAEREGILKNVTGGDFGNPAQRQMVAEILFRGLLHETVEYSPLTPNGYTNSGVTLGSRVGLEEITGVVVANEIADLGGSKPLAEGRTNLDVDGTTYKLNLATTAEEIGTAVHAYIKGSDVLAREDAGTDIKDNAGAKTKVSDLRDGLRLTDETEYYVNYDPVLKDTSDWRLEYVITKKMTTYEATELVYTNKGVAWLDNNTENGKIDAAENGSVIKDIKDSDWEAFVDAYDPNTDAEKVYTYNKVIPVRQIITTKDHNFIWDIFEGSDNAGGVINADDDYWGEVYVATKSGVNGSGNSTDISDELNYWEFYEKYIDDDENRSFDTADRGEWLRVIDNDGDGDAEYVLRVDFVMTTITDYDKRTDTYTVEYDVDEKAGTANDTAIKAGDIAVMSEDTDLSVGAVVLYTLIDGVYHVCNPQVDTYAIEKKTIDIKAETFTANGEEYTWSGIDKEAAEYYKELVELDEEVTYDLYLDHFGFVRLATEASKGLILLTDGYFGTNYRENDYKATAWTGSALEDIDVEDNGTWKVTSNGITNDGFIDTLEDDHDGNRGTWLRLNGFGEYYYNDRTTNGNTGIEDTYNTSYDQYHYVDRDDAGTRTNNLYVGDPFYTNIAAYTAEDGVYSLYDVRDTNILTTRRTYNAYEIAGTEEGYAVGNVKAESVKAKNRTLYGINQWSADDGILMTDLTRVQTTADTVYYFVADANNAKKLAVTSWTGYENVPEELGNFVAKRAYMVTHEISDTSDYEIADVVVFEGAKGEINYDAWLIVSAINTKRERSLGKDEDGTYGATSTSLEVFDQGQTLVWDNSDAVDGLQIGQAAFYDADGAEITENFAKYGVYAATVVTAPGTRNRNYCEIRIDADEKYFTGFYTDEINAYELNQDTDEGAHASRNLASRDAGRIDLGDEMIVMCDDDMNVLMAVNVSKSGKDGERDGSIQKLNDLHAYIEVDQDAQKVWNVTATFTGADSADEATLALTVDEVSKDTGRLELALNTTKYTITDVEVTGDGEAAVIDDKWTLIDVKEDVEIAVTVAKATYTVTIDKTGVTEGGTVAVAGNTVSTISGTSKENVPYGEKITVTITPNGTEKFTVKAGADATHLTEVSPKVTNTYEVTVEGDTTIKITDAAAATGNTLTAVKVGDATVSVANTMTKDHLAIDTESATVVLTVSDKATVKLMQTDKDFGTEVTGTHDEAANTWTYTLDVDTTGIAYFITVTSEAGSANGTIWQLTLQADGPSTDATLKIATGETNAEVDAVNSKVKFDSSADTKLTLGGLKRIVLCNDETASYTVWTKATDGTEITDDGAIIPSANAVIKVTAASGAEKTYTITYDK